MENTPLRIHSAEFLDEQRGRLEALREQLGERLSAPTRAGIDREDGRDFGDLASQDAEADLFLALCGRGHDALRDIDDALRRMDGGTYGLCEVTGELISVDRLRALPFARLTIGAQRHVESRTRKVRSFGMEFDDEAPASPDS